MLMEKSQTPVIRTANRTAVETVACSLARRP